MPNVAHRRGIGRDGGEMRRHRRFPRMPASQARAVRALASVSWVPKVLEATMNSVRAGSTSRAPAEVACRRRSRRSERAARRRQRVQRLDRHRGTQVRAADPMLTTSPDPLARCGRAMSPPRTPVEEAAIPIKHLMDVHDVHAR